MFYQNSGPNSLLFEDNMRQQQNMSPQLPPKTPSHGHRTPVMGTKTFHRRTNSNASSQQGGGGNVSNRNSFQQSEIVDARPRDFNFDYPFQQFEKLNNFMNINQHEHFEFHSLPYDNSSHSNVTNALPNTMRIYENLNNFQPSFQSSSPSPSSLPVSSSSYSRMEPCDDDIKTPSNISISNAEKRKMFFSNESSASFSSAPNPHDHSMHQKPKFIAIGDQILVSEANMNIGNSNSSSTKISGSTGCTPTHSTPQDSFSDDSSYLSALSRIRFSPDNFLDEGLTLFSPTSRITIASMQRAMVKRTMELEDNEKS